jgi:hypothetical protein
VQEEEITCIPGWSASVSLEVSNDISTGEENLKEVYAQRSRLYRFKDGDWKERGTGEAKLFTDPGTGMTRFLLRQEKTMKIVGNFYVIEHETYCNLRPNAGNEKCWTWTVHDCADPDEPQVEQFALRFGSEELAAAFKEAFDKVKTKPDGKPSAAEGASQPALGATSKAAAAPPRKPSEDKQEAKDEEEDEDDDDEEYNVEDYDYDENYVWPEAEDAKPAGAGGAASFAALAAAQNSGWKCDSCMLRWPEEAKMCSVCDIPRPGFEADAEKAAEDKKKDMAASAALFTGGSTTAAKATGFSFAPPAAGAAAPLFGAPAAAAPLFGAPATAAPLFGAPAPAAQPLFGAAAPVVVPPPAKASE